ncbi:hypothetical protein J5K72_002977, partial [Enterococcus faecalis]|nr:hypothetical protein [Enterococcus faecalis]
IRKFSILDSLNSKAFHETFEKGLNLIVGEKDSGKTSLARAIMYTFGCDVRNFELQNQNNNLIFVIEFTVNQSDYILVRRKLVEKGKGKNYFKLFSNNESHTYFSTKDFKDKLNEVLNIDLETLDKQGEKTKLYPNHLFLPFYMDQDYSWQTYLNSTFSNINFINNYKKIVLEFYTGMRSNEYYRLSLRKNEQKKRLLYTNSLIESKNTILQENLANMKIIEDVDIDKFQEKYKVVLSVYENIVNTEHKLKDKYNKSLYDHNRMESQIAQLNQVINQIIPEELEAHCPNCNQLIYKKMSDNYELLLKKENLINEREKLVLLFEENRNELSTIKTELKNTLERENDFNKKMNATNETISLSERAESYAFSQVNIKLEKEINELRNSRYKIEEELELIEEQLNSLNKNRIHEKYQKLMRSAFEELDIPFSYNAYYRTNFESVNINQSGLSKVQAFLSQYLSIYEIIDKNDLCTSLPIYIDTYIKDDFSKNDFNKTTDFLVSKMGHFTQSFLSVTDNEETIKRIMESGVELNILNLKKNRGLFTKEYEDIYIKYKANLE